MAYKPTPTKTEGGQKKVVSSDDSVKDLLLMILNEMKIMNVHLSLITDNQIVESDIN